MKSYKSFKGFFNVLNKIMNQIGSQNTVRPTHSRVGQQDAPNPFWTVEQGAARHISAESMPGAIFPPKISAR